MNTKTDPSYKGTTHYTNESKALGWVTLRQTRLTVYMNNPGMFLFSKRKIPTLIKFEREGNKLSSIRYEPLTKQE